jgi:hypothetical protein
MRVSATTFYSPARAVITGSTLEMASICPLLAGAMAAAPSAREVATSPSPAAGASWREIVAQAGATRRSCHEILNGLNCATARQTPTISALQHEGLEVQLPCRLMVCCKPRTPLPLPPTTARSAEPPAKSRSSPAVLVLK